MGRKPRACQMATLLGPFPPTLADNPAVTLGACCSSFLVTNVKSLGSP